VLSGVPPEVIRQRLLHGWSACEAVFTPVIKGAISATKPCVICRQPFKCEPSRKKKTCGPKCFAIYRSGLKSRRRRAA
jgi:hypothetical protein